MIAGGNTKDASGFFKTLSSAELYDPRTGTFTVTGNKTVPHIGGTATLLNDGKVLFAGYPGAAELYDPARGTFVATGSRTLQSADTVTLLPNGKVLITRGHTDAEPSVIWAEVYDPSTGAFTATGYATTNHTRPTATLLMNGKVLIAGGDLYDGDGGSFIAEHYDPATGGFSRTGNMTVGREQHTATLLPDGSVLFAGGHLWIDLADSAKIYDPIEGAFTRAPNMPTAHESHTATLLDDGIVLIAGGFEPWPFLTGKAEIYHPPVLAPSPQLFSVSGDGRGHGAILHANTPRLASSDNPAAVGEALEIYLTGHVLETRPGRLRSAMRG